MDPALLILLFVTVLIAGQAYYFGFHRQRAYAASRQQACFVVCGGLLLPCLLYVLVSQAGSQRRLEAFGFPVYHGIVHSVGLKNGTGDEPTWLFALDDASDDVLAYYGPEHMEDAWELVESNALYLLYHRNTRRLLIAHQERFGTHSLLVDVSRIDSRR